MEVDPPTSSSSSPVQQGGTTLKRSNSAPMINLLVTTQADVSPVSVFKPTSSTSLRRLSSSNLNLAQPQPAQCSPPIRSTDRVARLKQEEIHIADREKQHEKETQSSLYISSNWGRLTFDSSEPMEGQSRRPRSYSESLHIMTQSNILCGSPSPTRAGVKQCFSPSMQIPVKNTTFTPSPSPSPTRKNFMRSLSPIAVRTGHLKRKLENDGGERCEYISPPKKFNTGLSTPDRNLSFSHPLAHSISSTSPDGCNSDQMVNRTHHSNISGIPGMGPIAGRSPLTSHSPLSISSGGASPHRTMSMDNGGLLMPSKPTFLFRPVSDVVLCSPSSTSSSSSSLSTTASLLHPQSLQEQQNSHQEHQRLPGQQSESAMSTKERPLSASRHMRMSSDVESSPQHHQDVYMSDSEMRDHFETSSKASIEMSDHSEVRRKDSSQGQGHGGGFNFKPISPDHP